MRPTWLLAVAVLLSGCVAGGPAAPAGTTAQTPSETSTPSVVTEYDPSQDLLAGPCTYPNPPANVTPSTAKDTALTTEKVYVYNTLVRYNFSEWSVGTWQHPGATAESETADGYLVDVQMPYSYQYGSGYADVDSEATYLVNATTVLRVEGDEVDPPGTPAADAGNLTCDR